MPHRKKPSAAKKSARRAPKRDSVKRAVDLIKPTQALIATPDDFGPWLAAQAGRLPADFELDL